MVLRKRLSPYVTKLHEFDEESGRRRIVHRKAGVFCILIMIAVVWALIATFSIDQDMSCCVALTRKIYRFASDENYGHIDNQGNQEQPCVCSDQIDRRVENMLFEKMSQLHQELSSQCVTAFEFGIPVCAASYQQNLNDSPVQIMSPKVEKISKEMYVITEEYSAYEQDKKRSIVQTKERPYSATVSYDTAGGEHVASKHVFGGLCHCVVFLNELCKNFTHDLG